MLLEAWERVLRNDGCAGHDGQSVAAFAGDVSGQLRRIREEVLEGRYRPLPLQAITVPKADGGIRMLAVPAVRDRVLQTAAARVLCVRLEPQFDDASFAYRPGRSVAMAVQRVCRHRDDGLRHVLDLSLIHI